MSHVIAIGVRELRREASRWLARVRAGETFIVTDRGIPIAQLAPLPVAEGYARLVADGRLLPGPGRALDTILDDLDAVAPPRPDTGLSGALDDLRRDER